MRRGRVGFNLGCDYFGTARRLEKIADMAFSLIEG